MENVLEPNIGIVVWQILILVFWVFVIFIIIKLYRKIIKYIDLKIEYLINKLNKNNN